MLARPIRRLEAALYAAIAAMLAAVLLERALAYFALAERAAVQATLFNTQSALYLRLAQDRLGGTLSRERHWEGKNPFELANMEVRNYAGEREDAQAAAAAGAGQWVFDRRLGELVYNPRYRRGLEISGGGELLRFRLVVPADGRPPRLEAVQPWRWDP